MAVNKTEDKNLYSITKGKEVLLVKDVNGTTASYVPGTLQKEIKDLTSGLENQTNRYLAEIKKREDLLAKYNALAKS